MTNEDRVRMMTEGRRATLKGINKAIAKHGVELERGDGYYYLCDLPGSDKAIMFSGGTMLDAMGPYLNAYSLEYWVKVIEEKVEEMEKEEAAR